MKKILLIYRNNIYGIIGTLMFHIALFASLIFFNMGSSVVMPEEEILIDFSDDIEEIVIPEPEPEEEKSQERAASEPVTNRAVNRAATSRAITKDHTIDEEYNEELAKAQELLRQVSGNLGKKVQEREEIDIPETEDKVEDKVVKKSGAKAEYRGDSNINYNLLNRDLKYIVAPTYLSKIGGEVIVDIVVNRDGKVIKATPRGTSSSDISIVEYAKEAALSAIFNKSKDAEPKQVGTITFRFVQQSK